LNSPIAAQQLDNFTFVIELPKVGPEVVVNFVGITRCALCQFHGSLYGKGEIVAIPEVRKVLDLLFRPAVPLLPRRCAKRVNIRNG
jgi:hypothetical protein